MSAPTKWPVWIAAVAAVIVLCAITAAITLSGTDSELEWLEAAVRVLSVGVPVVVGLYARRHPPFARFGTLLVATGCGWFLTTLSGSSNELLYSIGRVSGWLAEVALVYVVLAFPSGRLARPDRILVAAVAVVVGALYLPTALLVEAYPTPSVYMSCVADCPGNAFMLVGSEPAFVENVIRPLREVLTVAIFAATTLRLIWRVDHATHLMRRLLVPVALVAGARLVALAVGFVARAIDEGSTFTQATTWLIALAIPVLACAFLVGLIRWRLFIAVAMERLAASLRAHPRPEDLRAALADAFEDPSLDILYRIGDARDGRWADAEGRTVDRDALAPARGVTEVVDGDRPVAAIVHDPALQADRAFIESATSYAVMTFDNHRLTVQTSALLQEIGESRARIQAAADDERRRIEADLHDGAQQRLVALRIKLELAAERLADGNGHSELLRGLGQEVDEALDELRSLARGIYPAPLSRGLVEALRSAALQAALPTVVHAAGVGRYMREVETAAYFCCLEAMQNAAKHAQGATAIVIDLFDNGALMFEVRDDGAGFDPARAAEGMGFTTMRDRIAAVGGQLGIESSPGRGARVTATIPVPASAVAAPVGPPSAPRR